MTVDGQMIVRMLLFIGFIQEFEVEQAFGGAPFEDREGFGGAGRGGG